MQGKNFTQWNLLISSDTAICSSSAPDLPSVTSAFSSPHSITLTNCQCYPVPYLTRRRRLHSSFRRCLHTASVTYINCPTTFPQLLPSWSPYAVRGSWKEMTQFWSAQLTAIPFLGWSGLTQANSLSRTEPVTPTWGFRTCRVTTVEITSAVLRISTAPTPGTHPSMCSVSIVRESKYLPCFCYTAKSAQVENTSAFGNRNCFVRSRKLWRWSKLFPLGSFYYYFLISLSWLPRIS